MTEHYTDVELENVLEIIEEEFDSQVFYRALSNALAQLDTYVPEAA